MILARALVVCGLVVLPVVAPGCMTAGPDLEDIRVDAEANPKVNFEGYETYAWAAAAAVVHDPDKEWTTNNLDVGAEIMQLTNRELRARGLKEVVESPDVLVLYGVGVDMKAMNVVVDPEDGTERMQQVPKGGIMVLLADPTSRQVMWIAAAEGDLREDPPLELAMRRLDYAVTQMFKKFPR